ncbi:hypothetical protein [Bradyrhizobium sp. BR 1432]|uniref:hypothetical protein n=1 Tax=Bradyrhizobium sp. BR 1432 TaxID=3447966 RepID=UPI003EE4B340
MQGGQEPVEDLALLGREAIADAVRDLLSLGRRLLKRDIRISGAPAPVGLQCHGEIGRQLPQAGMNEVECVDLMPDLSQRQHELRAEILRRVSGTSRGDCRGERLRSVGTAEDAGLPRALGEIVEVTLAADDAGLEAAQQGQDVDVGKIGLENAPEKALEGTLRPKPNR